ncbi:unnamed protein product [Lactuca saligna]|uniref:Uncharacterized protein n=1 Tax=Lactuca saligna TaxID=75948 RepID=A0AA36EC07_LACSI|nr:unnamed protein product [Lactuca saligna]
MQRISVAVRQLIYYNGQPDPLKDDAFNKSVRETAQEDLSTIFAGEDNSKPPPQEGLTQRIQGFGNTNFDVPSDDKKSFLSDMVGIGSETIKRGKELSSQIELSSRSSTNTSGSWGQDLKTSQIDTENGNASSSYLNEKSREERLLETIVTYGGVRLQPTRDAIHVFLMEASKLNAVALSHALEA